MVLTDGKSQSGVEDQEPGVWEDLKSDMQEDHERTSLQKQEIMMLIEQSQIEVNKLAQKNAMITANVQRVQAQFDSLPREEIRTTFETALDAQQRLFVMRGQLEKLQSDQKYIDRYIGLIERFQQALQGELPTDERPKTSDSVVEMMIQAQEAERQRLSRQMHDGPAQALSNFILQTEIAMRLFDTDKDKAHVELENLKTSATTTFQQVREFIFELRPMMLDDLGFIPTIKRYTDALKEKTGRDISLRVVGAERRLEPYLEVMIFRAVQELLNNAIHHSNANQIVMDLEIGTSSIKVVVDDNGRGFDTKSLASDSGMGLKLIRERVEMLGGTFDIKSVPGQGTHVVFQLSTLVG